GHINRYQIIELTISKGLVPSSNKLISNLKLVKDFVTQVDQLGKDGCKDYQSIESIKLNYFSNLLRTLSLGPMDIGQFQTEVKNYFDDLKKNNDKIQSDFVEMKSEFAVISNIEDKMEELKNERLKTAKPKQAKPIRDS